MKSKQLLLGLILALSVFLRLWRIDEVPVSLFGDELDVGYHAYSILKTGRDYYGNFMPLHFHSLAEWRTPLYIYSCVPTVAVFGISPLGVRFPAAIFGVAGVAMMYFLVRKLFGDERLSVLAAGLMAVSPWSIQYSRAGFEVTELLFFLLAGMYMFLVGMEKGKWLWVASVFLAFTPWIYSSAKLFTPIFIVLIIYKSFSLEIPAASRKSFSLLPAVPTKGRPCKSSSFPGASPIKIIFAVSGFPSAKTMLLRVL